MRIIRLVWAEQVRSDEKDGNRMDVCACEQSIVSLITASGCKNKGKRFNPTKQS